MTGFDPVKHGPAVWQLQGLKWADREMGAAKVFKGWSAARLAQTLGLDVADVQALLEPPTVTPARPAGPAGPAVGTLWTPRRLLFAQPVQGGGYALGSGVRDQTRQTVHLSPAELARVVVLAGDEVLSRILFDETRPPVLVRCPVLAWTSLMRPSP